MRCCSTGKTCRPLNLSQKKREKQNSNRDVSKSQECRCRQRNSQIAYVVSGTSRNWLPPCSHERGRGDSENKIKHHPREQELSEHIAGCCMRNDSHMNCRLRYFFPLSLLQITVQYMAAKRYNKIEKKKKKKQVLQIFPKNFRRLGCGALSVLWSKKKNWIEPLLFRKWSQRELEVAILLGPPWDPTVHVSIVKKIIWMLKVPNYLDGKSTSNRS